YNWGEGAVKRAIEKNTARGLPTDYASLNMPNETRHYVPKLQALKNIFGNPVLMVQLGLPEILNRPYFATIDTEKPIDVKTAARLANMPLDEFLVLNPSHNRPVIRADSALVLPADKLETFRSNLEKYSAPLTEWQTYTLKHGEKLDKVAPRFGIALPELLRVNGLPQRVRLGAGSTVLVPAGNGASDLAIQPDAPALTQIIEAEPVVKPHGRTAKSGKGGKAEVMLSARGSKSAGKHAAKAASGKERKLASAGAGKSTAKSAKAGNVKSVAPSKVARAGNGRRS
ncbi:MAG TPA: lytic transglycosylase, partial [Azonexus sp.]|nr:lytic transglycosylase [Azonexus sp.]